MMKRNIAVIAGLLTFALSGCEVGGIPANEDAETIAKIGEAVDAIISDFETSAFPETEEHSEAVFSPSGFIIKPEPIQDAASLTSDTEQKREDEISFLSIYSFFDGSENSLLLYPFFDLFVNEELEKLITEYEFENWSDKYKKELSEPYEEGIEKILVSQTDLNEYANIYSFICDFNLSEEQIREALIKWNETNGAFSNFSYTEEDINVLTSKNKVAIVNHFANSFAVIKNDKVYVPGWFFYASTDDYKNANITDIDLIDILGKCRNTFIDDRDTVMMYFYDVVESKAYDYLNGDVDLVELCGYERDFSAPIAYDGYYYSIGSENYSRFFSTVKIFFSGQKENIKQIENIYIISKDENSYSPHWVYYNKPEAYREAGITPDELIAMLPLYKSLGIMSDEAITALEMKLEAYAAGES